MSCIERGTQGDGESLALKDRQFPERRKVHLITIRWKMRLSEVTPPEPYPGAKPFFLARICDRFSQKCPEKTRRERISGRAVVRKVLRAGGSLKQELCS